MVHLLQRVHRYITGGKTASRDLSTPASSSPTSSHSPVTSSESLLTSSAGALVGDALPYSVGVDDVHTFACCYCDKAFSRISYLSKHRQVCIALRCLLTTLGRGYHLDSIRLPFNRRSTPNRLQIDCSVTYVSDRRAVLSCCTPASLSK